MRLEDFCDRYDEWSESALRKKIASLEDLKDADDVVDIASVLPQDAAVALVKKAYEQGTSFSSIDLGELIDLVDNDLYLKLVRKFIDEHDDMSVDEITDFAYYAGVEASDLAVRDSLEKGKIYSPQDISKFDCLVSVDVIDEMLLRSLDAGTRITAEEIVDLEGIASRRALNKAIRSVKGRISASDLEDLEGVADKDILIEIDKMQGTRAYYTPPAPSKKESIFSFKGNHGKNTSLLLLPLLLVFWPFKIFIDVFLVVFAPKKRRTMETELHEGDHVWIKNYDLYGVVIGSHGRFVLVSVHDGERVYSVPRSQLRKTF